MVIPFGEWLPDLPVLENPGATVATNVIPAATSYRPFQSLAPFTSALSAYCRGAISVLDNAGNSYIFAGDDDNLYQLSATAFGTANHSSGAYALGDADNWEFVQFGERVIATTLVEPMQVVQLGSASFTNLITSTLKPQTNHIDVVREFVVGGYMREDGTDYPQRVRWSALDDATQWSSNASTQSDFQDLFGNGGHITRVVGGEVGLIFQERSIFRMIYTGPPLVFQFDEVEVNRGAMCPGGVVKLGAWVYFISDDGFYRINQNQGESVPIGKNKVDEYFLADFDPSYAHRVVGAVDFVNNLIYWAYPGADNTGGTPNKILIYSVVNERWSLAVLDTEFLFRASTIGYTLDELDNVNINLDLLEFSLDSNVWRGGRAQFAAFNSSHKLSFFSGQTLDATVETAEAQLFPGRRSLVTLVRPYVETAGSASVSVSVRVSTRDTNYEAHSFGPALSLNVSGDAPARSNGRYVRVRVSTSGNFNDLQGVDFPHARPVGSR